MRVFFVVVMLLLFVTVKSQSVVSPAMSFYQHQSLLNNGHLHDSLSTSKKWFFSSYSGLSTSVSFFNGGNASIFSSPMGLQLNRRLNNNWYAFANVSMAPSYVSINPPYLQRFNKNFSANGFKQNSFGLYPAASIGAIYINDAKTFSISGSVSAERGFYPGMPWYPANTATQPSPFQPSRY